MNSLPLYFFADSNGFMFDDNRFVVSGLPPSAIAFANWPVSACDWSGPARCVRFR